ncbi:heterokaryon incompatibility protein [Rutstroemia sp. NJR-2017a BBW]|nr:heterokaryon incompatibility protein [Rutstroemia sp. NJR-2017a BBW]
MTSNSFIYNSLPLISPVEKDIRDRRSILVRLLKLLPGDEGHPIRCSLGVVDLASPDMEAYEALSYVWGPSDSSSSIVVNDQPFRVSSLLFQALVHLRDKKTPRALWIDALCVNQNDLVERSSQVLYMHQIYSSATGVIVWLGEDQPWGLTHTLSRIDSQENDALTPTVHFGITRVTSNLLSRPWWTRVWIVQEFILARSIQIQCGSCTLSWDQFCVLVDGSVTRSFFPKHGVYLGEYQGLRRAREFRTSATLDLIAQNQGDSRFGVAMDNQSRHETDLLSLIYNFRSRQATEPRDKVFAFLGLAEDNQAITLLNPDYERQISFLSIDLARNHIYYSRTLSVVALAECTRRSLEKPGGSSKNSGDHIPTWCPSFMSSDVFYGLTWQPFWTGLPTTESRFSATNHLPILSTSAVPSSPLGEIGTKRFDEGFYNLTVHVISNFKVKISDDCRLEGVDELMAQTKTNITWDSVVPTWRSLAQKAAPKMSALEKEPGSPGGGIPAEELFHLTLTAGKFSATPSANDPREEEYLQTRRRVCSNRHFFVTYDGRFGIGPDNLKTGDEVLVVIGMQVPVILRKASDEWGAEHTGWIYVGQAYVHDRMVYRGDLQHDIESGRVELEEMVLI